MSIQKTWISLLLSIAVASALQLGETCTRDDECDGNRMMRCDDSKCQCITPWYTPCKASCEINHRFAYQGDECRESENCIGNTICQNRICECKEGFTGKEGACLKNLNVACGNATECWSNYCFNSVCSCAPGFEPVDNTDNCQKKLVHIFNTWEEANVNKSFCQDQDSCIDVLAECIPGPGNTTSRFCRCPEGYDSQENKRCERVKGALLSPLDTEPSNYGKCGYCEDDNAACIKVVNHRTCWCQAGYFKNDNKCEKQQRSSIVFPNSRDISLNNFQTGCESEVKNGLCACAAGYKFIDGDKSCQKIEPKWENDMYEYGLCTQIDSDDGVIAQRGICAEPLKCEEKVDKHICTCGVNKFIDLDNSTNCVYYIGKEANADNECPSKNAERNPLSRVCQCLDGYKPTADNRQCELKLSPDITQASCNLNASKDAICRQFGNRAFFCNPGECRCSGQESFPNSDNTHCYALVNITLTATDVNCPPSSALENSRCKCDNGFRPSDDLRTCVHQEAELLEHIGAATTTNVDFTTAVCQSLFTGPVVVYGDNRCQCKDSTLIVNDNKTGCWYRLDVPLTNANSSFCPPHSSFEAVQKCECLLGYKNSGGKCIPIANRVFIDKDPAAVNVIDITAVACVKLFGRASTNSTNGNYCICHPDAYPVNNNAFCYFLINKTNDVLKDNSVCPPNAYISGVTLPSACICNPGFYASPNNETCELSSITLSGVNVPSASDQTSCVHFNDLDCTTKYGRHAFCKDDTCYCNRQLSFINNDGQCESFSNYKFPGEHELNLYACNNDADCGKPGVVCNAFTNTNGVHKVCQCKDGLLLDPKLQTCEARCVNCNTAANFECRDYQCRCKSDYYLEGDRCVLKTSRLQLYQSCNATISRVPDINEALFCDQNCSRAKCTDGYRPEGNANCVRYQLSNDKCLHRDTICQTIDKNSRCDRDKNQCLCRPSYYSFDQTCAKVVGSQCSNDTECGENMSCTGKRCECKDEFHEQDTTDSYDRPIKICSNGIDKIRFTPVILLIFVFIRLFFI